MYNDIEQKITLFILRKQTRFIKLYDKTVDIGLYVVNEESYSIEDMLELGWCKEFIRECVFKTKEEAYKQMLNANIGILKSVQKDVYSKEEK